MKPAKTNIFSNESVQSQTDASSVNATPFVPPETKIEWQEEPAPALKQSSNPAPVVVRAESGAGAALAPIPAKTVSRASDMPDSPHTLAGISSFDTEDTERDNRSLLYLTTAGGLLVAALLVLGLGVHVYYQRLEEGKSQAAQPLQAAQPQNAVVQKTDAKPTNAQALASQAAGAKPVADASRASAQPVSAPQASAAQSPAAASQSNASAAKPAAVHAADAKAPVAASQSRAAKTKPVLAGQTQAKAERHAGSGAGLRAGASAHLRHASAAHRSAATTPKVQVVNGVKHYSDIE